MPQGMNKTSENDVVIYTTSDGKEVRMYKFDDGMEWYIFNVLYDMEKQLKWAQILFPLQPHFHTDFN